MAVALLDLQPQYQRIRAEIQAVIQEVCDSQRFILGPEVEAFEAELATYCGSEYAVGVSSGTDAILLSLMAYGVGPGDEVITTPYTFFATIGCIARLGAKPVLVDIDPADFNIDSRQIESKISAQTKAIMPVHLYGQCAEMSSILEVAERHNIPVVEDAAQAIGAKYNGQLSGSLGHSGCFSFFPSKNLGAFGDAGMVTTNDALFADKLKSLRMHGETKRYHHRFVGGNFRIDALQAAVLRVKLKHLDSWAAGRVKNAARYQELFSEHNLLEHVSLPTELPKRHHVYNQFILRAERRDELIEFLRSKEIGCNIYYPIPLHLQECFEYLGHQEGDFPESERAAKETLALPIYAELSDEQLCEVVQAVRDFYS